MEQKRKDPKEKKCAICGKDIYAGEDWAYKRREKSERTKWFCSYKCMRQFDAKHQKKQARPVGLPADLDAAAPKEPVSRAVVAKALAKEIKAGHSVIAYLNAEGYKNPYQAYDSVRHYCETKMPELAEVLKPLRDLQKEQPQKTSRPKKPAEVEKMDMVPPVESIAHVTPAELEEAIRESEQVPLKLQGGVNYQLKVEEDRKAEEDAVKTCFTKEEVLRIVDEATLNCQDDESPFGRWSNETLDIIMFREARKNAVKNGVMKLRKEIRKMLGAEAEEKEE